MPHGQKNEKATRLVRVSNFVLDFFRWGAEIALYSKKKEQRKSKIGLYCSLTGDSVADTTDVASSPSPFPSAREPSLLY